MMTMRRLNKLAVLSRALVTGATNTTTATTQHRLIQRASFSSSSSSSSVKHPSHWFANRFVSYVGPPVSGTVLFSAAASSMVHEVHAKEAPSKDFVADEVVLYQYEACPFCNKLKAFLDYYDIPYKVVEVNPISKKEIKWSDYKKVPILTVDGKQIIDSSAIIDQLYEKVRPGNVSSTDEEEKQWRGWVDSHLVHMLSPNIYRNSAEALEAFEYITTHGNFSFYERVVGKYAGAAAMYFVSKRLKKRYNITDERESLYEAANTWVSALNGRDFLGGGKPNLADLAVFGVLRPIRYFRSGKDMVEHTRIGEWYTRMENAVGESSRITIKE